MQCNRLTPVPLLQLQMSLLFWVFGGDIFSSVQGLLQSLSLLTLRSDKGAYMLSGIELESAYKARDLTPVRSL